MSIYDTEQSVEGAFDKNFIPEEQLQTQWSEFIELKKVITQLYLKIKRPITILDIGIGDARIIKHLRQIEEIWKYIEMYHGIDNAAPCIAISNRIINDLNIGDKTKISFLEADDISSISEKYDVVMTTWFTAGNFFPADFPFDNYKKALRKLDLRANPRFEKIFSAAYNLLNPDGEIILGSVYIDDDKNRIKQENFYNKLGMEITTDKEDSFTATKEKFWSQRFTKEKILNYFHFVEPKKISFTELDTYGFAMQVSIKK